MQGRLTSRENDENEGLAAKLKEHLARTGKSIYQLSKDSGIDAAYIWRVLNAEKREVSREAIIIHSVALAADDKRVDEVIDVANDLLDAAGHKALRHLRE